jgi:hypothetical protein
MRFLQNTKENALHFFQQVENHPKSIIPESQLDIKQGKKSIRDSPPFTKNLSEEHPCGKKYHILFIEIYRNIMDMSIFSKIISTKKIHVYRNIVHIFS